MVLDNQALRLWIANVCNLKAKNPIFSSSENSILPQNLVLKDKPEKTKGKHRKAKKKEKKNKNTIALNNFNNV